MHSTFAPRRLYVLPTARRRKRGLKVSTGKGKVKATYAFKQQSIQHVGRYKGGVGLRPTLKNDPAFKIIPHLPAHHFPSSPRQNTSTYLQETKDKKINACALYYITTYLARASFSLSLTLYFHGGHATLYLSTNPLRQHVAVRENNHAPSR